MRSGLRRGVAVAAGGALGALARVGLGAAVDPLTALLAVDLTGAAALGALTAWTDRDMLLAFLGTGLLGSWTTFSGLALATAELMASSALLGAAAGLGTTVAGLLAAIAGRLAATSLRRPTP